MYYLEAINGKKTFKVKGVDTSESQYTYEALVELFKAGSSVVFAGQTQFATAKTKSTFKGIRISEDIVKSYKLGLRVKRK